MPATKKTTAPTNGTQPTAAATADTAAAANVAAVVITPPDKPAKPAKPRRFTMGRNTFSHLYAVAQALEIHVDSLGLDALQTHRGDAAKAAASILQRLHDANIVLWDRSLGGQVPDDSTLRAVAGTLEFGIRRMFLDIFITQPETKLAEAALATGRLDPLVIWSLIQNHRDMTDAHLAEPGNPKIAATLALTRAHAVGTCLDTVTYHFAAFLENPAAEPPRDERSYRRLYTIF